MNRNNIFALLTDFGFDFAVASMKALLIKEIPQSTIIDIDHSVSKFSINSGSFIIKQVQHYFPKDTIFICIIDPGVGSLREALCVESDGAVFFGPNNGIFSHLIEKEDTNIFQIDEQKIKPATYTFHGRDLFVPAAIKYSQGDRSFLLPLDHNKLIVLEKNDDYIAYIDSFGNIKTTLKVDNSLIPGNKYDVIVGNQTYYIPFVTTFSDVSIGTLLCYKGSNETLEIAVNLGSAQQFLQARVGESVEIK